MNNPTFSAGRRLRQATLLATICAASLVGSALGSPTPEQEHFFQRLGELCGATFTGTTVFPDDPGEDWKGQVLVAHIETCGERELRVPFSVGENRSRTWIIRKVEDGLELKHDHRHPDGTPDEVTLYGGTTRAPGTALAQSFPADDYTADLIPEAATNEWFLSLSEDASELTYYLERHGKPRFKAVLKRD